MGIFEDMDKMNERLKKIRGLVKDTANKIVEMEMTYDDYDYFKNTLNNEITSRQIGKE